VAVLIARTPWIDDDGTGQTGTILNNAIKTELYNQIDAALAALVPAGGGTVSGPFTVGGVLTVSGLGTHRFSASGPALGNIVNVENTSGSGDSYAQVHLAAGTSQVNLFAFSQGYSPASYIQPNSAAISVVGAGGLSIVAFDAAAAIRFYTGGTALQWQITPAGYLEPAINGLRVGSATNGVLVYPYNVADTGTAVVQTAVGYLAKQTSSARFKEHLEPWALPDDVLHRFLAVSPHQWDYTGQASGAAGFVAEDLDALPIRNRYGRSPLINYDAEGRPESNRDFAILALQHLVLRDLAARVAALEGAR